VSRRVALLCGRRSGHLDSIAEYSRRFAEATTAAGHPSTVFELDASATWRAGGGAPLDVSRFDALLLQYNAFSFGRRGWAPWLPQWWARADPTRPTQILVVHEAYVPGWRPRELALGVPQRMQMRSMVPGTDAVMTTCGERLAFMRGWDAAIPIDLVPVGSNLTPSGTCAPRRHGVPLLVSFGGGHPSRRFDLIAAAVNAAAARFGRAQVAHLGADARELEGLTEDVDVIRASGADDATLSGWLAAGDLALLPYSNGAATNRTTLAAVLEHRLPILTTAGPLTDSLLRAPALRMVPRSSDGAYAAEAVRLLAAPRELEEMRRSSVALHAEHFAWDAVARKATAVIERAIYRRQAAMASE